MTDRSATHQIVKNMIGRCSTLHSNIAGDVFPDGGTLRCRVCGCSTSVGTKACALYLAHGWPKHCDRTMQLITGAEATNA